MGLTILAFDDCFYTSLLYQSLLAIVVNPDVFNHEAIPNS